VFPYHLVIRLLQSLYPTFLRVTVLPGAQHEAAGAHLLGFPLFPLEFNSGTYCRGSGVLMPSWMSFWRIAGFGSVVSEDTFGGRNVRTCSEFESVTLRTQIAVLLLSFCF
jgi:hypothetical protein